MKKFLLLFCAAIAALNANAAVGDVFTIDNLTYTVLTEDTENATGTVSVKAKATTISGQIEISANVENNGITYSVTKLVNNAFSGCKRITSVVIPNTITAIPTNCFYNNTALTAVEIPSTIKSFGTYAFAECKNLPDVTIPSSLTTIPSECFMGCVKISDIVLPASITSIGANAFYNCTALANINLQSTKVKTIGQWAFYNTSIATLNLPTTLTKIDKWAFNSCSKLTTLNGLNNTKLTSIGQEAFAECTSLNSLIKFPATLKSTGQGAFLNCKSLTTIDLSGNISAVNSACFSGCISLQNFEIPSNVKTIGSAAFYGCTSITSISIPATLQRCGTHFNTGSSGGSSLGAFQKCTNLKNVSIEEGVTALGTMCFAETAIEEIIIPASMTHLGYMMSDEEVTNTVGSGEDALNASDAGYYSGARGHNRDRGIFHNCKQLKKVTFAEGNQLTSIGYWCFNGCTSLEQFEIPSTVKFIGENAFSNTPFEYLTIPDGVNFIGDAAFSGCANLRLIKIPNSVEYMKSPAAYVKNGYQKDSIYTDEGEIKKLYSTTSVNGNPTGSVFSNNKSQTHVTLPSWLKTSGQVIRGCDNISEITIPAYVIRGGDLVVNSSTPLKSVFFMGDSIPKGFERTGGWDATMAEKKPVTFYVKKSVYNNRYPEGYISGRTERTYEGSNVWVDYNFPVSYKVPVSMTNASGTGLIYKTLCRDFDVDLTHTNDNLPEGVEPLRAYLVEDVDGDLRMVFLNEIKYIPSRLKANVTDADGNRYQGVDEYVGVILRGTPGYTYYYEIGEHDYTQGAEGQWLMDDAMEYSNATYEGNLMAGTANDDEYVYKTVEDDDNNTIVNYGLNSNKFKIYHKDGWLTYNKSYLQLPKYVSDAIEGDTDAEGNANLTFLFQNADGSTTKVSSVEFARNSESDIFYNAYGQRVNANTKGIVINNGKKYVNK